MKIGVFVAVCDADFEWVRQFVQSSPWPIALYGDNLSRENWQKILALKPLIVEAVDGKGIFSEKSKQQAFNILVDRGYDWAVQMDIDETWEQGAADIVEASLAENPDGHIGQCNMVHVIQREGELFIRQDPYYSTGGREGSRDRIYNMRYKWRWVDPLTNGAYPLNENGSVQENVATIFATGATTVHWGYMTHNLRVAHRRKWDDVYIKAAGRNPYKSYDTLVEVGNDVPVIPMEKRYMP